MDTHSSIYNAAFRRWKSARTALARAIDDYLAVSSGLCDALSSSAFHSSTRYPLEQTLSGIDLELSSLLSEEEKLKRTRMTLAGERNKSVTLIPIYKLPSEVLVAIFTMATGRYTRHDRTHDVRAMYELSPTTLSGVCSSWRQLAIGSPSLWSHIDVIVGGEPSPHHHKQARLWVERSQNVFLHVNIQDRNYQSSYNQYGITRFDVEGLVEFLAPIMHRVRALDTKLASGRSAVLSSVMECWVKNGSPDIEKTVQILNRASGEPPNIFLGPAPGGAISVDEFNAFFRSFKRLLVHNCRISERVLFHEGLVELHLQEVQGRHCPTQQEFVSMLTACPRLRILVLANFPIGPSEDPPSPVTLDHLQSLSLESDEHSHALIHVLRLLIIGSEGLSMSLTLDDEPDFIAEVKVFFSRTKVTRLCVRDREYRSSLTALFCLVPYLETLAIEHYGIFGPAFRELFEANDGGRSRVPWPRLHTLYLKDLSIDPTCLQKLVLLHRSLKKLHIYRPCAVGDSDEFMTDEECDRLDELLHMVEDFDLSFNWGDDPIDTWDFVILEE